MMYNSQLETFICVVESGSFSKAAEKLFISSPAVIKQINSLEASLGLQLFNRTHRGLVMTEAGKSIYNDARYVIDYCRESVKRAKDAMQISDDVIRVGISPVTPPQIFVELWPEIQRLYPDMKFQLVPFENTTENGCDGIKISMEPFCVGVSFHHRLARKNIINLEDMEGENLMLMYKGWSTYNDKLRSDLIKNYPGINITDIELYNVDAFNRCENNNGLLLTIKSWESVHPLIKIIPVDWDYKILYGLLYSKEPSDKVKRLIKAVEKLSNNQ